MECDLYVGTILFYTVKTYVHGKWRAYNILLIGEQACLDI